MAITTTFDRSQLGDKIRVYRLAPAVGFSSKEFVSILASIGLKKAAQSNLTRDEALAVLDYLDKHDITPTPQPVKVPGRKPGRPKKTTQTPAKATAKPAAKKPGRKPAAATATKPAAHTEEFTEEDKLRYRVEKNVENELNQLKEKAQRDINHRIEQGILTEETPRQTRRREGHPGGRTGNRGRTRIHYPTLRRPLIHRTHDTDAPTLTDHTDPFEYDEDDDDRPKRRRGKRGTGRGRSNKTDDLLSDIIDDEDITDDDEDDDDFISEPLALKGSTRLEAQRRRRMEMREESRKKRHIVSEAEFLARRESVNRTMWCGNANATTTRVSSPKWASWKTTCWWNTSSPRTPNHPSPETFIWVAYKTSCQQWKPPSLTSVKAATACSTPGKSTGGQPTWEAGTGKSNKPSNPATKY